MAHLDSTFHYCKAVSAHMKAHEQLVASFPLSQRPFERLDLSPTDRRRFHTQATELLGYALKEYEEYTLYRHRQVDRRRWKPVKSQDKLTVYRESRSYVASRSLSVEDEAGNATRHRTSGSSTSSGASNSGSVSVSLPAHQVTELELLTGWGPTATEAREQKKRAKHKNGTTTTLSGAKTSGSCGVDYIPALLGLGSICGSLDDVMYGVAAPDSVTMALKNSYLYDDVLDEDVLAAIEGPSKRSPFRFLGIKWLVHSASGASGSGSSKHHKAGAPRDLVYLEATGVITGGDGIRIGYQIMQSVNVRGCPELTDSHGVVRAHCESVYLFVELNNRVVDVFLKSNATPKGKLSESAALQSCTNVLLNCEKSVQCSHDKKLMWQLESSGNSPRALEQEEKAKATQCSVCEKSFSRLYRHSFECKLCSSAMCSKCCVERTLNCVHAVGNNRLANKYVSTIAVSLCTSCVATTSQASALDLAREEVASGRFGRVSDNSLRTPGHHRGSDQSGCRPCSIATIANEDIPGQPDHRTQPVHQAEESTHNSYHIRSKESRRSQREQGVCCGNIESCDDDNAQQSKIVLPDATEILSKRGHACRESSMLHRRKNREQRKTRARAGSHEPVNPNAHARQPTFRRGQSNEVSRYMSRAEVGGESESFNDRLPSPESIVQGLHQLAYDEYTLVELDTADRHSRGQPVNLSDLVDASPSRLSKDSIRETTSSSESCLENIAGAGIAVEDSEAEEDDTASQDTFDSFTDLINISDDMDDVYETLDTKDMEAVKRSSQVNRKLWQQIAELRDAAENVYQYTKESAALHITQSGTVRSPPLRSDSEI
uniref:FYVE-type domain-containing protein n=1 Tax=Peronospora matthiolae TaxID=2874970 RepID=A0AAV1UKM0_9STRA